ncbi:ABC-type maltose transport system permease subunit [Xanthomonas sp. 3498]|nr:ABC-type maltose transport system permease subunit [Xanthomonas sp. 3498]
MTLLTLMGSFAAFAVLSGLPMFLFVMYAQLTQ